MTTSRAFLWLVLVVIAAPANGDEPQPIPFDAKKAQVIFERRRAFVLEQTLDAYALETK
jgi:hypothetical protein